MKKVVDFVVIFEDGTRKRHHHEMEKGKVVAFSVQLEVLLENGWKTVIRYDCAHGFAHVDQYDLKGRQTKRALALSFESALTFGDWDINKNWPRYKQKFLEGE